MITSDHCVFPTICDKASQCEYWLRNREGCATLTEEQRQKSLISEEVKAVLAIYREIVHSSQEALR